MSARDTGPGARHGCPGQRDISRVVWRAATLVMWGLCALGAAMGTAWAAPATGTLSCAAVGAPSRVGLASNAGSARITLNSAQGAGGTKLIVHGTGWPANAQITVNEESNGQGIPGDFGVQVVAAADGTFEAPAFGAARATCGFAPSPGLIVQIVARTADKQVSAMAPFTYVASPPALTSPSSGDQVEANATSVAIAGTNWDAGVVVTLWTSTQLASMNTQDPWHPPTGARTTQAQADTQGVITADVPLAPGQRPGTWIVVSGSATSARYGEVVTTLPANFFLQPPVAPALRLDRTQGSAGATVTVTGSQYWPGDTVTIAYCRGAPRPGSQPIVAARSGHRGSRRPLHGARDPAERRAYRTDHLRGVRDHRHRRRWRSLYPDDAISHCRSGERADGLADMEHGPSTSGADAHNAGLRDTSPPRYRWGSLVALRETPTRRGTRGADAAQRLSCQQSAIGG